jgi:hypothetical protein
VGIVSTSHPDTLVPVEEMSTAEGRSMLHGLARDTLGISGDEFLVRLDEGEYDTMEQEDVLRLVMLAPFAR